MRHVGARTTAVVMLALAFGGLATLDPLVSLGAPASIARQAEPDVYSWQGSLLMILPSPNPVVDDAPANDSREVNCLGLWCPGVPRPAPPMESKPAKDAVWCMGLGGCGLPIREPAPAKGTPQNNGPTMCGMGPSMGADPFTGNLGMLLPSPLPPEPEPQYNDQPTWCGGGQVGSAGFAVAGLGGFDGSLGMILPGPSYNMPTGQISQGPCLSLNGCPGSPGITTGGPVVNDPYFFSGSPLPTPGSCGSSPTLCGPGAPTSTEHPVDFASGQKSEYAVDLVVPLPGRDFELARSYSSATDNNLPTLVGANWHLNVTTTCLIDPEAQEPQWDPAYIYVATPGGSRIFERIEEGQLTEWFPVGPSAQKITRSHLDIGTSRYPVFTLHDPGNFTQDFLRVNIDGDESGQVGGQTWATVYANADVDRPGLVKQLRDTYGNAKTFVYEKINQFSAESLRLRYLHLNGTDAASAAATVTFDWITTNENVNVGRLDSVTVTRGVSPSVTVAKVEYEYQCPENGDVDAIGNGDTGTNGDLLQVAVFQPLDRADQSFPTDEGNWHVTVTQYRYHNPAGSSGSNFVGAAHQLKMVLAPEQVEYAAHKWAIDAEEEDLPQGVLNFATNVLLTKNDSEALYEDGDDVKPADLASKVVETYETSGTKRVTRQFLLTTCGCSGAAQGLRLDYTYRAFSGSAAGSDILREMQIDERVWNGSSWGDPLRTRYFDLTGFVESAWPSSPTFHALRTSVLELPGSPAVRWVWHIEYDSSSLMSPRQQVSPPAACRRGFVGATTTRMAGLTCSSATISRASVARTPPRISYGETRATARSRMLLPRLGLPARVLRSKQSGCRFQQNPR